MNNLALWMEQTFIHKMVVSAGWIWATLEAFHFIGLTLLLGSLILVDLRILGYSKETPIKPVHAFIPVTIAGFAINLTTGVLFLFGEPTRYFPNAAFQWKMLFVFLVGLNVLYFKLRVHPEIEAKGEAAILGIDAKIVAGASLIFWIAVIILGRLIPYVE